MNSEDVPENQSAPNGHTSPAGLDLDSKQVNWRSRNNKPWLLTDNDGCDGTQHPAEED